MLIPKIITTDENNLNFIKIVFQNKISFLINKETKEVKDLANMANDEEENLSKNGNENGINEDIKEEIYGLTNDMKIESEFKLDQINKDKLNEINQSLEIAKMEKKEKQDNEVLFKDLLKEKNIKEDGIFEKECSMFSKSSTPCFSTRKRVKT